MTESERSHTQEEQDAYECGLLDGIQQERERVLMHFKNTIGTTTVNESPVLVLKGLRGLIRGTITKEV